MKSLLTHTQFIDKRLGAPMVNINWSYGAIKPTGEIILNIWGSEIHRDSEGTQWAQVYWTDAGTSLGFAERLRHIEAIKNGIQAFAFIIYSDKDSKKLKVGDFQNEYLVELLNEFKTDDANVFIKLGKRIAI